MPRTSDVAVEGLLRSGADDSDYDGESSLQPFIDTANVIVTRVAACATAKGITLSSAELELIERWLAAHFYKCSDQAFSSESTGGASGSYQGQTGMYLEGTKYGQTAINLDYSGCLLAISKGMRAGASWLGKVPSERIPYEQRD